MKNKKMNRRTFLGGTAAMTIGSGIVAGASSFGLTSCKDKGPSYQPIARLQKTYIPNLPNKAKDGKPLKVGVVGCGGRGTGATFNFLDAANNVTVGALADLFEDRLEGLRGRLKKQRKIEVPDDKCFVGFDAYKKLMDTDVDVVILTTPPCFRPVQFKYAVEKGKHAFLEKPICVDPTGYRTLVAAAKQAEAKRLSVVTGTQRRHQRPYVAAFKKIKDGMIGEIVGGNVYWNGGMLWYKNRQEGWSDMEWMIRDWVNWSFLSGDHIVEQHVHNIDIFNWFSGRKLVKATGFGSRQRRVTGNQYDNFSIDFEYEGGIHLHSMCRQINGCANNVSEFIQGTMGSWSSNGTIKDLEGKVIWKYDPEVEEKQKNYTQNNPYVLEHVDLINHIRNNKPVNEVEETAFSSLCAVMGRESAYKGSTISWDQMVASPMNLVPEKLELGKMDMESYAKVPVPGKK